MLKIQNRKYVSSLSLMFISVLLLSEFSIALNISLGKDKENDMLKFETSELEQIIENFNATKLNISTLNNAFDVIKESDLSTITKKPSKVDLIDIEFDLENFNISFEFKDDLKFTADFIIGVIWNSETHYTFLLSKSVNIYSSNDSMEFFDIEIDDNKFEMKNLTETFDSKDYIKAMIFYIDTDNSDFVIVELYDNLFNFEILIFLFWFLIGIIIIVILVILLINYLDDNNE